MTRYGVTDIRIALVTEGAMVGGKAAVVSFSDCNLWDGNPLHRGDSIGPCGHWCDAAFEKGKPIDIDDLLAQLEELWPIAGEARWVWVAGGEPTVQLDVGFVKALHQAGWRIAVETNGNVDCPALTTCEHVVVSPKLAIDHRQPRVAHELRVTLPGAFPGEPGWTDDALAALAEDAVARWPGIELFVSPQDPLIESGGLVSETALRRTLDVQADVEAHLTVQLQRNLTRCIDYVKAHPRWRLSVPTHKLLGLPV